MPKFSLYLQKWTQFNKIYAKTAHFGCLFYAAYSGYTLYSVQLVRRLESNEHFNCIIIPCVVASIPRITTANTYIQRTRELHILHNSSSRSGIRVL